MSYTINPNAKNKWARNAENTMDLSLETDASSVYLDNGRTLEQELGEGSMISNVATVDNSMSKVVDGTLDGAYESCMFKGKSLVNLCPNKVINYTAASDWDGFNVLGQNSRAQESWRTLQDLKPNTKYFISCYVETFNVGERQYYLLNNPNNSTVFAESLEVRATGLHKWVLTSKSELTEGVSIVLRCQNAYARGAIKIRDIMIIEYQDGMENWDIPYFEGLCDVKMPILRNVGKNLFDGELEMGGYTGSDGSPYKSDIRVRSVEKIFLSKGTYTLSSDGATKTIFTIYDLNGVFKKEFVSNSSSCTITLNENCMVHICVENEKLLNSHIQLEQGSNTTPYEDYKTNILHTPETVTLRSLPNGVCDTFNVQTGVYIQRIKEIVFDGSNDEEWDVHRGDWVLENSTVFYTYISGVKGYPWLSYTGKEAISDKIPSYPDNWLRLNDVLGMTNDNTGARKQFRIPKSYLETDNVDGFRKWLKQNPVTAYFELVTPITTTIEPLTIPFAYENGHIILESGFEGQSLLPTLEYSTVINRVGQIQSIANTIQKQEKQITKLEQMLIQNIINLDYNNTLLTLKNEMEEML